MFGGELILIGGGLLLLILVVLAATITVVMRRPNTGGGYARVVNPSDNLSRACMRCGHVTRAFDNCCPQCGASLVRRRGGGCLVPLALIAILILLGTAFVGMLGGFAAVEQKLHPTEQMAWFVGDWRCASFDSSDDQSDYRLMVSNLAIKRDASDDQLVATYRLGLEAGKGAQVTEQFSWNYSESRFDVERRIDGQVLNYALAPEGSDKWTGHWPTAGQQAKSSDSNAATIQVARLDEASFEYRWSVASGEFLAFRFTRS